MAIGARLKIVAGGMTQTDEIHSGGSYISQSDQTRALWFGQSDEDRQPGNSLAFGKVETLKDLEADKFYLRSGRRRHRAARQDSSLRSPKAVAAWHWVSFR